MDAVEYKKGKWAQVPDELAQEWNRMQAENEALKQEALEATTERDAISHSIEMLSAKIDTVFEELSDTESENTRLRFLLKEKCGKNTLSYVR